MNGPEEAPMRAIEERVRDAFGAAAETVTARDLPGPPGPPAPGRRSRGAWGRRAWARGRLHALIPVAAAACIAVIAVATAVVVPRLLAGPPGSQAGALAGAPKFFAGVANPSEHFPPSTVLKIYRSANGRVAASVRPPRPEHEFAAVGRLGHDRAYVAAAVTSFGACTTQLYRFSIDARGRPSTLTPLSVPQITGIVVELTGSADGNVLAYTAFPGKPRCVPHDGTLAGVIHLATRQVTTWAYDRRGATTFGSVSLNADGSVLGFAASDTGDNGAASDAWVLPTSTPAGPLTGHARKVLHLPTGVWQLVLNNTGSQAYVETGPGSGRGGAVVLGLYDTATGKQVRLLGRLSLHGRYVAGLGLSLDAAGRHLLAYGYPASHRVTEMNLTSGRRASTTAAHRFTEGITAAAW
jgi:hypothetical protein